MEVKMRIMRLFVIIGIALQMSLAHAQNPKPEAVQAVGLKEIGKVSKFSGVVSILSGSEVLKVTAVGQKLKTGDRIKTDEGEVEVEMTDGAMMKVSPYTVAGSDERVEKKGILFWKKDEDARRVTCYVGKLWFKSGEKSEKKNYLQTPTAVCALRGSDGDVGYDNKSSFLNMYHGTVAIRGDVSQGSFGNFGRNTAAGSAVYNAISRAIQAAASASVPSAGQSEAAKEIVDLKTEKAVLAAVQAAAEALLSNPDPVVQAEAQAVAVIAQAEAKALDARIVVEIAKVEAAAVKAELAAAQLAGDAAKVAEMQEQVAAADQVVATAQESVATIVAQLVTVTESFVAGDFSAVNEGAQDVIAASQDVITAVAESIPSVEQIIAAPIGTENAILQQQIIAPPPPDALPPPPETPPPPPETLPPPPEAIPYENQ